MCIRDRLSSASGSGAHATEEAMSSEANTVGMSLDMQTYVAAAMPAPSLRRFLRGARRNLGNDRSADSPADGFADGLAQT